MHTRGCLGALLLGFLITVSGCGDGSDVPDVIPTDVSDDSASPADAADPVDVDVFQDVADCGPDPDIPDATETKQVDMPSPHGRILLTATKWGTGEYGSTLQGSIIFHDKPMRGDAFADYHPDMYEAVTREGPCVMYMRGVATCDPACEMNQYCDIYGDCQDSANRLSAGDVVLMLGQTEYTVEPTGADLDWYSPGSIAASLFHSGNTVIASSEGHEGGFGAFELTGRGVDPVDFSVDKDGGTWTLVDDGRNIVTWDVPETDITGMFVDIIINVGWHGAPPQMVLYCRRDASAGSLEIPLDMVKGLPPIGGIGLFQHPSYIGMNLSVEDDVDSKTVQMTLSRRHGLNPLHNVE